jgi:outer membrane protein OmpA-like peptidoglycan-associated protein/tetratricopeptide (TPR) repeat protein
MKRFPYLYLTIVFFWFSNPLQAQDYRLELADRYFENTFYSDAIPIYEELANMQPETKLRLADAYCFTFQYKKAAKYYGKVFGNQEEKINEAQAFRYIQVLKALGNFQKAEKITRTFLLQNQAETEAYEEAKQYLENVKAIGERYEIKNLALNTESSEFGATIYNGKLVFAAPRKNTGLFDKMFRWNDSPYLDLYAISEDSLENPVPKLFSEALSTRFHESNAVFSPDGNRVFFTRNNYIDEKKKTDSAQVTQLQIYKAELKNGKWTNVVSLPFNDDAYSTEHPALSPDGKTLYFASNMPGGFGEFDLYKVNTENFENPINLGPEINTEHKEQFPFVDSEGNLYFASDGHPGFGFLDVFIAEPSNKGFAKPDNVGLPVNSGYDDFAFYIELVSKNGYFSSNRPSGKGSDDIYKIRQTKPLIIEDCYQFITGKIIDGITKEPLPASKVVLFSTGEVLDSLVVSENAEFKFKVNCEKVFQIFASKSGYTKDSVTVTTSTIRKKENKVVLELTSKKILEQRKKEKKRCQAEAEKQAQKRIAAQIKAEKIAKEKEEKARQEAEEKAEQERAKKIVAAEEDIVKEKDRVVIKTEPIYFDYDLWYIRKESREVLDKVIALLNKYPTMEIEIGTHTDVRGTHKYNDELSEKRSASVMDYFISKGIDPTRIEHKGYGERFPIIECVPDESCTEAQHEINRRCEFVIISF